MRRVSGKLRLELAQYRELVTFLQFGSDLDKATQEQITRGEKVVEMLKQGQYEPLSLAEQIIIISAGVNGSLDDFPTESIRKFEQGFFRFMANKYPDIEHAIQTTGDLSPEMAESLSKAIQEYKKEFISK